MAVAGVYPELFQHPLIGVFWELLTIPVMLFAVLSAAYSFVNTFRNGMDDFQKYLWLLHIINAVLLWICVA